MPEEKKIADYFIHYCNGKDAEIIDYIESGYGNTGYAFWNKIKELVSFTDNHFYDCNNGLKWGRLVKKSLLSPETVTEMLDFLATENVIDPELWNRRIIWIPSLIESMTELYRRRKSKLPQKPELKSFPDIERNNQNKKHDDGNCIHDDDNCNTTADDMTTKSPIRSDLIRSDLINNTLTTSESEDSELENNSTENRERLGEVPEKYKILQSLLRELFKYELTQSDLPILKDLFEKLYPSTIYTQLRRIEEKFRKQGNSPPLEPIKYIHSYMKDWSKTMTKKQQEMQTNDSVYFEAMGLIGSNAKQEPVIRNEKQMEAVDEMFQDMPGYLRKSQPYDKKVK